MVAAQTAYGIEVEVEGYEDAYDASSMLFMDFRRHHSGTWRGAAPRCAHIACAQLAYCRMLATLCGCLEKDEGFRHAFIGSKRLAMCPWFLSQGDLYIVVQQPML